MFLRLAHPCLLFLLVLCLPWPCFSGDESVLELDHYHNYSSVKSLFSDLERRYPRLAKLHSIGLSAQKRQLYVLQVAI